ncbi:Na+/H+ antiporter [Modestobacter sp. NPDC049651]|uniref:Na+/H+ antiporter n=1 Tax=unclassified Modestobacter TaxID=2643866 RepID=UPI0033EA4915
MAGLELVVLVGVVVVLASRLAGWVHLPPPLLMLLAGAALSLLPGLGDVTLPPDVVLLLFLPALLYWEALNSSLREIRANLRVILLASVGLVLATAAGVAVVAHALGLDWPMAWVLGAVLAPTDATAVATLAGALPRRVRTMLTAESLVNDGTALVLYAVALGVALGGHSPSSWSVAGRFAGSYAGGLAIGLAAAAVALGLRRLVRGTDLRLENAVSLVTPFLAYLPAEALEVSGVVAVVTCGLVLSQLGSSRIAAATRVQATSFWQLASFLLNGALFVLIGLQLHPLVTGLSTDRLLAGLRDGVLIAVVVAGVRVAWSSTVPYVIRALDRRPAQRLRRMGFRQRMVNAWAGFRGAVSLAAALAVPATGEDGTSVADRDVVLLVTFVVIALILVVQGPTMPLVVRWARFPADTAEADEERAADRRITEAALGALEERAAAMGVDGAVVDRIRADYLARLAHLDAEEDGDGAAGDDPAGEEAEHRLRVRLLADKRAALIELRNARTIDDIVLRRIQGRLDVEELRLTDTRTLSEE